jgi:hypothetical protein
MILRQAENIPEGAILVLNLGVDQSCWRVVGKPEIDNDYVTFRLDKAPPGFTNGVTVFVDDYLEVLLYDALPSMPKGN